MQSVNKYLKNIHKLLSQKNYVRNGGLKKIISLKTLIRRVQSNVKREHDISPTRRFAAGVSPTRRFAARMAFRPRGALPTRRFAARRPTAFRRRGVSPTRRFAALRFADAASPVGFDNKRIRRASLNPNPCHQKTKQNPESEYFNSVA